MPARNGSEYTANQKLRKQEYFCAWGLTEPCDPHPTRQITCKPAPTCTVVVPAQAHKPKAVVWQEIADLRRHGRACPGLSRPSTSSHTRGSTWMPGSSRGRTEERDFTVIASEAKQSRATHTALDCRVASLLAVTLEGAARPKSRRRRVTSKAKRAHRQAAAYTV